MNHIRIIAFDIDGVLLKDTFSPVIKSFVEKYGGIYSRELERNVFSKNRDEAAKYLIQYLHLNISKDKLLSLYFQERKEYINQFGIGLTDGAGEVLEKLLSAGLKLVCYGGLSKDYYQKELAGYISYFDRYICTNDFRPGLKEIAFDIYKVKNKEILFIDDVNTVAEEAKRLNMPFIGMPSSFEFSYQRADMIQTGVKHIISNLKEINLSLIRKIDKEADKNILWD